MSEMEKHGMYFETQTEDEFGEKDEDNPNKQLETAEKPQKKKGFFKSVFGGIKSALGGGDKNSKKKSEEELALQPKPQQQKGVNQSPKNQHQRRMVAENDSISMK